MGHFVNEISKKLRSNFCSFLEVVNQLHLRSKNSYSSTRQISVLKPCCLCVDLDIRWNENNKEKTTGLILRSVSNAVMSRYRSVWCVLDAFIFRSLRKICSDSRQHEKFASLLLRNLHVGGSDIYKLLEWFIPGLFPSPTSFCTFLYGLHFGIFKFKITRWVIRITRMLIIILWSLRHPCFPLFIALLWGPDLA